MYSTVLKKNETATMFFLKKPLVHFGIDTIIIIT